MAENPYPIYEAILKETKLWPEVSSVKGADDGVRVFPTFFTCSSILCHPTQSACSLRNLPSDPHCLHPYEHNRQTNGGEYKEGGCRESLNSKREKWNVSINGNFIGVNAAANIGKGIPIFRPREVKHCIFNFLHSTEFDYKTNGNIYSVRRL